MDALVFLLLNQCHDLCVLAYRVPGIHVMSIMDGLTLLAWQFMFNKRNSPVSSIIKTLSRLNKVCVLTSGEWNCIQGRVAVNYYSDKVIHPSDPSAVTNCRRDEAIPKGGMPTSRERGVHGYLVGADPCWQLTPTFSSMAFRLQTAKVTGHLVLNRSCYGVNVHCPCERGVRYM